MKEGRKREKAENFIGWVSQDGKLKVVGIAGKQGRKTTFKVTCTECSKDPDLFPEGYFVSLKQHLINGQKPCGCSSSPKWRDWQFLILARRAAKARFIVHGFNEEFHGRNTKLNLECLKDRHKWTAIISSVINQGTGCPMCSGNARPTEQEALQKCIDICKEMDYDAIGFVDGYKNNRSHFEYNCKIHGKQNVSYVNFVNGGRRCGGCWEDKRKELVTGFYGFYPERKDEVDFLYVLDFNGKFIKVGRSFDIEQRIKSLKCEAKIKKITRLRILTATHQEIYNLEQELHNELRDRNLQYHLDWSTECFQNDCQYILNKLLDSNIVAGNFEEISH